MRGGDSVASLAWAWNAQAKSRRVAAHFSLKHGLSKNGKVRYASYGYAGGLQCVPFARTASGIQITGNAVNWWDAAAGVYERGSRPEQGSVLNFRATGGMHLGHVAVVSRVINSREIEIDHANWAPGSINRGVPVIDVSEANDWSAVRVALGRNSDFGSVYPTYGFIYDRPDSGTMVANTTQGLRQSGAAHVMSLPYDEVAEAPRGLRTKQIYPDLSADAPARSIR